MSAHETLTVLGREAREPLDHVECFPAPNGISAVTFHTEELASMCPVTRQPDLSDLTIEYTPNQWCIESKSLKLYLWSFRNREVFAEALAVEIAEEVRRATQPKTVKVTLRQKPRGGITVTAVCELEAAQPEKA